jgi:hypothetical protein
LNKDITLPDTIKYIYEDYVLPKNIFLVSSKKNIGFDNFKNCLYNDIFNIYTYLSIDVNQQPFNKDINITDNKDNTDIKSNYNYYMDKFKKKCSFL